MPKYTETKYDVLRQEDYVLAGNPVPAIISSVNVNLLTNGNSYEETFQPVKTIEGHTFSIRVEDLHVVDDVVAYGEVSDGTLKEQRLFKITTVRDKWMMEVVHIIFTEQVVIFPSGMDYPGWTI